MNTILLLIILYLLLDRNRCRQGCKRAVGLVLKNLRRDHHIEVLFRDRR